MNFSLTCVNGGYICPWGLYEGSYQPQGVLHNVQKGGDFPVIIEGSTGQELVNQGQQPL